VVKRAGVLAALLAGAALTVLFWPEAPPGPTGLWLSAAGLEARYASVAGLRVRYVRAGSGPAVVLLHGLASSIYTWKDVLPALAADHDVVALDLPGFGDSDQPVPLRGALLPEVVAHLIAGLGLERPALVGHSLGGAVAVLLAARPEAGVSRLALLDAAGFQAEAERPALVRVAASPAARLLEVLPVRRRVTVLGLRQVFFDDALVTTERVDEYLRPLLRPSAVASQRSLLAGLEAELAAAFTRALPGVRVPTLIVWGRDDAWIPVSHAARFVGAIAGARSVVLERCGHNPQEERPAEVMRLLTGFLDAPEPVYAPRS
jgi:4,5:9,10-diseco-3-hydroxy-5,9,17-trioxoandrosta-1(10),2-diene-4-oate hydrolase